MVSPKEITTAASLLEALDDRSFETAAAKKFDEEVWASCGCEGAMMVTDLSGFTRVTKKFGILHFLAMFRRTQQICLPLIEKNGGTLLKQEADDFIVLFPDTTNALACALEMLAALRAMNATIEEENRVYMCIGIEYGSLLRLHDDAFGDAVNVAFKLGEDVAGPNEIRMGVAAYERLEPPALSGCTVSERISSNSGNVELEHYCIQPKPNEGR